MVAVARLLKDALLGENIEQLVGVLMEGFEPPPGSGGDSFDLAAVGLAVARYVRIANGVVKCSHPPKVYELDLFPEFDDTEEFAWAGLPILTGGVIPQPSGAKGVFTKPTAKPAPQTVPHQ